jgi:hypothetical protein
MINTEGQVTKVRFGNGKVAVSASDTKLILQELKAPKKIGEKIENDDDINKLPSIEMDFSSYESIDVLIRQLQRVRDNWMKTYGFALAC